MKNKLFSRLMLVMMGTFLMAGLPHSATAQIASEPVFNLSFADLYAELFPEKNEAFIIAKLYLTCNGSDPVVLRCEGNFKSMKIGGQKGNEGFYYTPPFFQITNLASGEQILTFAYEVEHKGLATSGAIIGPNKLKLGPEDWWYPRNSASDAHQVYVNVVTPPDYTVDSDGAKIRDIPNNLKRLRSFLIRNPTEEGISLFKGN